jgi:hypothetical protein
MHRIGRLVLVAACVSSVHDRHTWSVVEAAGAATMLAELIGHEVPEAEAEAARSPPGSTLMFYAREPMIRSWILGVE